MKTLKLSLCFLATFVFAVSMNAETWNCGEIDPDDPTSGFSVSVKASLETISGDSVLRIFGSGRMADFSYSLLETQEESTDIPWHNIAEGFKHVYVENGVEYVGKNAFRTMTGLQNIYISKTVRELGENFINDHFDGNIYCSATSADAIPDASGVHTSMAYMPEYFNLAHIYVAPDMVPIFVDMAWWRNFGDNISESLEAASVVTVPQDSLTDTKVTIFMEEIKEAVRYEVLVKSLDETDIHHFYTYDDPLTDKWVIEPIAASPMPRRLPALHRDTVSRTTETLQIDITNLQPATNYNYSITAYNISDEAVGQQSGVFKTPVKQETGIDEFVNEKMVIRFNLLGQPVDENYRGIIITNTGEKILLR